MAYDIKARLVEFFRISPISGFIRVGGKFRYDSSPTFDDPLDIPNKQYIDNVSSPSSITKTNSDVLGTSPSFYITVPELDITRVWSANYTISGGDPVWISPSMLQSGKLYGFPDPTTNTYTIKINYI